MPFQRPTWLPSYMPELDGLRGLAILWVVLYHCDPLLKDTWMHYVAEWGWAGVIVFFVLSGFLITANLLATRDKPHYFHNFHARRALRIWPVYALVLAVVYLNAPWFIGPSVWEAVKTAPWLAYIFFVQNLFHVTLPPALGPSWALAIEEQYYFFWAPLVRWLRRPWMLAGVLACALVCSPLVRHLNPVWLWTLPTHTLIKLDGIALGSLMALGLYTLHLSRRVCLWIGLGAFALGIAAAATVAGGTSLLDTALAMGFAGAVLALMASTGARNPINVMLRRGPLAFYGRISYGLYMIHIVAFIFIGWFDLRMVHYGMAGNLAVVAARLAVSTALAAAMWYGFESQILKLKRYF
ncbi:MAG TPA: acyltransferase [Terracidiphilus sp.]|nr:acyltransferase [Terracidiphilus sp.]